MKNLVVVESPAKAKTIEKYLGKDFKVLASFGHVRDLLPKSGAVDTDNDFAMKYQIIEKNSKYVDAIVKAMKNAEALYLATDPDREGEAISWHLYEILQEQKLLQDKPVHRVAFHEVTKTAIKEAIDNPRSISMDLVNAQQARRALDYLVGFNLSPVLWRKIRKGLSAGRVQSPALRLIVEREIEIENFEPREYWTIDASCKKERRVFNAKLNLLAKKKITQFSIIKEEQATETKTKLLKLAKNQLEVTKVEKKQRRRQPASPFTTSTLQQEAVRKLNFATKRTMQIAQQLYEGIDTGDGATGLITYMRTDSVNLAEEAVTEIRTMIQERYGKENLPKQARKFKTKAKNAQEAHEAIRPTSALNHPEDIKSSLNADQFKLYTLIWKRTIACQMMDATLDTVAVDLACGNSDNNFRANGSVVVKPGFLLAYEEGIDDKKQSDNSDKMLPPLEVGELVKLQDILANQHFTEPAPRFSEASLVKSLEEFGIGRPSTYSAIISTLQQREYVILEKKRFIPTDVGQVVNKLLTEHFKLYIDYDFTAKLEDQLDEIARGEKEWIPLMNRFWSKFKSLVDEKMKSVQREDLHETLDEACPKCSKPLNKRLGRRGHFIGCTGYPDCDYTRNLDGEEYTPAKPEIVEGRVCPKCSSALVIKQGHSKFIGCSNYPKCKFIESMEKPVDTGIACPECGKANLIQKKSRYGSIFYSCASYPTCKYAIPSEPLVESCPECDWPILMLKTTKRYGTQKICPQKTCSYVIKVEDKPE